MYNLKKLAEVISRDMPFKATGQLDFADYEPDYVYKIVVKPVKDTVVKVLINSEIIEVGFPIDGQYNVTVFRDTPFPYRLFPLLEIQCDCAFVIDFMYCTYDSILEHAINQIGVYYKILSSRHILMKNRFITLANTKKCEITITEDSWNESHVIIECADFRRVIESSMFSWLKPFVLACASQKYTMMALTKLGIEPEIPGIVIEKEKVKDLMDSLKYHFPRYEFSISKKKPDELIEWNKKFIEKLINHLIG
mgnify:FL=1